MERYAITVEGVVQGVGFRPFVHRLATRLQLAGFVRNQTGTVQIEAEGGRETLERFLEELVQQSPPLAQVERLDWKRQSLQGDADFRIEGSQSAVPRQVFMSPDIATCADCLAEIFDPRNRRFNYPFTNCTNCGPRLTIITGAPYDRPQTTMAKFTLCPACRDEYESPQDRRFHAQPIACPACGPQLRLLDATGNRLPASDPLAGFAAQIRDGRIGALKGLGGYHLVCLAENQAAVAELRRRKTRDEKPFAIMVPDQEAAADLCEIDRWERQLLTSPRAPIVVVRCRKNSPIAAAVAPNHPGLGVMLPYTPLHHLLLHALDGAPVVMTSGNRSDEPIAYDDRDALERLQKIADFFLTHDRPIHVRCDDSVTRVVGGIELPERRSRGGAPQPVPLVASTSCRTLAVGGQLKATFGFACGDQAVLSHHLGDLEHFEAYRAFEKDVELYLELFRFRPEQIAHDLHPDYASTRYALQRAARDGVRLVAVQHHHAHMASCMADNFLSPYEPVIGVTFDGTGFGTDGAVWGGEFLVGNCCTFRRAAQLRYVKMPGGEQAIRQPWRMAASHLLDADGDTAVLKPHIEPTAWRTVETMLHRRLNCPETSSMGRLFDAVASLAGLRMQTHYEGQAAMELEWLATEKKPDGSYPFDLEQAKSPGSDEPRLVIDTRPLIRAVADEVLMGVEPGQVARRFHGTIVDLVGTVCERLRHTTDIHAVVLSGGVFMNALLTKETTIRLEEQGFRVYRHRQVPPGDGGLSLGQLVVAAAQDRSKRERC